MTPDERARLRALSTLGPEATRAKCSICGLIYTPGQPATCGGDTHNLGLLTPEALWFAKCVSERAKEQP